MNNQKIKIDTQVQEKKKKVKVKHPESSIVSFVDSINNTINFETCLRTKNNKSTRLLEADYHTHPAWTKNSKNTALTGNIIGLAKKHKGFEDL